MGLHITQGPRGLGNGHTLPVPSCLPTCLGRHSLTLGPNVNVDEGYLGPFPRCFLSTFLGTNILDPCIQQLHAQYEVLVVRRSLSLDILYGTMVCSTPTYPVLLDRMCELCQKLNGK